MVQLQYRLNIKLTCYCFDLMLYSELQDLQSFIYKIGAFSLRHSILPPSRNWYLTVLLSACEFMAFIHLEYSEMYRPFQYV